MTRLVTALGVLALLVALAACVAGAPRPPTPAPVTPGPATATPAPALTPSPAPTATASPEPAATPAATATGLATVTCPVASGEAEVPPGANLQAADGPAIPGELGSYAICRTFADALPPLAASLPVVALAADVTLTVTLDGGLAFVGWTADYGTTTEWNPDMTRLARADAGAPVSSATIGGLPAGEWLVEVTIDFGGEVGSASYYWRVEAP